VEATRVHVDMMSARDKAHIELASMPDQECQEKNLLKERTRATQSLHKHGYRELKIRRNYTGGDEKQLVSTLLVLGAIGSVAETRANLFADVMKTEASQPGHGSPAFQSLYPTPVLTIPTVPAAWVDVGPHITLAVRHAESNDMDTTGVDGGKDDMGTAEWELWQHKLQYSGDPEKCRFFVKLPPFVTSYSYLLGQEKLDQHVGGPIALAKDYDSPIHLATVNALRT
jgi:hypothetical protein